MTYYSQVITTVNTTASMPADIAAQIGKVIEVEVMMINNTAFERYQFENWAKDGCLPARIVKRGFTPTHKIQWEITAHISTMGYSEPTWVIGRKHLGTIRIPEE